MSAEVTNVMTTLCYRDMATSLVTGDCVTEASDVRRLCLCPGLPSSSAGH